MKCIISILVVTLLAVGGPAFAQFNPRTQEQSSLTVKNNLLVKAPLLKSRRLQKSVAVPLLFTAAGLYSTTDNDLINKLEVQEERNEWMLKFCSHVDDYLQYAPIAVVYGLNALGVRISLLVLKYLSVNVWM